MSRLSKEWEVITKVNRMDRLMPPPLSWHFKATKISEAAIIATDIAEVSSSVLASLYSYCC